MACSLDSEHLLAAVFDGHGPGGERVSNFAAMALPTYLLQDVDAVRAAPIEKLKSALVAVERGLLRCGVPCTQAGTTSIAALLSSSGGVQSVTVGCVGDSRCCPGR